MKAGNELLLVKLDPLGNLLRATMYSAVGLRRPVKPGCADTAKTAALTFIIFLPHMLPQWPSPSSRHLCPSL